MKNMIRQGLVVALGVLIGTVHSGAVVLGIDSELLPQDKATQATQGEKKDDEKKQEKSKEQKAIDKFNLAIKDLPKTEGEFTLYTKKRDILMEVPEDRLEKLFFVQATLNTGFGPMQAGDPLNQDFVDVFKWRKIDDTSFQLITPNLKNRWEKDDELAIASERSFPEAVLGSYTALAHHPERKVYLVNVTKLFDGSVFKLSQFVQEMANGFNYDQPNSYPTKVKSFPENSVVQMHLHFRKQGGGQAASMLLELLGLSLNQLADERSLPLKVSYNLWMRKDTGYQPRLADPRVGYFSTEYFDVGKLKTTDRTTRLIQRWNLKKKNPGLEVSDPVKPVVWTFDPSVPEEYKEGVRQGILMWNQAFERVGISNAMVVQDAPKDEDWDHADGRYNVIRWTMTQDSAYAVAWFRTDPITGEILNAAVTIDANYPAGSFSEYREQVAAKAERTPWFGESAVEARIVEKRINELFKKRGAKRTSCDHACGKFMEAAHGWDLIEASGAQISEEDYVTAALADLVAHEVGHCLGLRHNFAGSLQNTMAELENEAVTSKRAIAASVMDYTPINVQAVLNSEGDYWNPTIGPYDFWAIEYGYKSLPGETKEDEIPHLQNIAMRSGQPGLLYLTDEDADGVNPLAVRWDLGEDVLTYLSQVSVASNRLMNYAISQSTGYGEKYTRRNALVMRSVRSKYRVAQFAVRMVGGVEFRRHLRGDIGEKPTLKPVDPSKQRAAMKHILKECLMDKSVDLPQHVLYGLSSDPNEGGAEYVAPLRDFVSTQQRLLLAQLLSSVKIDAILENEFKTRQTSPYSLVEHYDMITTAVFPEIGVGQAVPPLRRDLQRYALGMMIDQAGAKPGLVNDDARILANSKIKSLHGKMKARLNSKSPLDTMTKLHVRDMYEQIDRFLKRQAMINPN